MNFEVAAYSTIGGRSYQEDRWLLANGAEERIPQGDDLVTARMQPGFLALLADGIGGGGNGDVASHTVTEAFARKYFSNGLSPVGSLKEALGFSNNLLQMAKEQNSDYGEMMGTTLIAAVYDDKNMSFISIGDSPLYRFRDDEIHHVNELHTRNVELDIDVSLGVKKWELASRDSQRSAITSAITGNEIYEVQIARRQLIKGDIYILASDGLDILSHELIRRIVYLYRDRGTAKIAKALIRIVDQYGEAFRGNRHDNTTLVVVSCN